MKQGRSKRNKNEKKKSKLKAFQGHFLLLIKINERGCENLPEVFRQMLCCSFFLPGAGCFSVTQGIMPTAQLQHSASFVSLSSLTASSAHTHCSKSIAPPPFLSSFPLLSLSLCSTKSVHSHFISRR